jgi:hypothetical protein
MGRMGRAYGSAKGIVFIACDNATFMAGSAVEPADRKTCFCGSDAVRKMGSH